MTTVMTWEQMCIDPHLRDLPFKIEQDRYGRIVMSPVNSDHGQYQAEIAARLKALLPRWAIFVECGVDSDEGTKAPDVAAMTPERRRLYRGVASFPESPELCVEVLSPGNCAEEMDEKRRLYAARGCLEFWTCSEQGEIIFFDAASGSRFSMSGICPEFPMQVVLD